MKIDVFLFSQEFLQEILSKEKMVDMQDFY